MQCYVISKTAGNKLITTRFIHYLIPTQYLLSMCYHYNMCRLEYISISPTYPLLSLFLTTLALKSPLITSLLSAPILIHLSSTHFHLLHFSSLTGLVNCHQPHPPPITTANTLFPNHFCCPSSIHSQRHPISVQLLLWINTIPHCSLTTFPAVLLSLVRLFSLTLTLLTFHSQSPIPFSLSSPRSASLFYLSPSTHSSSPSPFDPVPLLVNPGWMGISTSLLPSPFFCWRLLQKAHVSAPLRWVIA